MTHLRALLQILLILVREHLIFSEGTFNSVDLSIQHMCIKCLLHCQAADILQTAVLTRPNLKTPCKQADLLQMALTRPKLKTPCKQASHYYQPMFIHPCSVVVIFLLQRQECKFHDGQAMPRCHTQSGEWALHQPHS